MQWPTAIAAIAPGSSISARREGFVQGQARKKGASANATVNSYFSTCSSSVRASGAHIDPNTLPGDLKRPTGDVALWSANPVRSVPRSSPDHIGPTVGCWRKPDFNCIVPVADLAVDP